MSLSPTGCRTRPEFPTRCSTGGSKPRLGCIEHSAPWWDGKAEELASSCECTIATILDRISDIPDDQRPRVYYARGSRGLETGLGGSVNRVLTAIGNDVPDD